MLDFRDPIIGSLKSPCTTSYRSSIDTVALNCLVFEKIAFFAFWRQTDGQTDRQLRCTSGGLIIHTSTSNTTTDSILYLYELVYNNDSNDDKKINVQLI